MERRREGSPTDLFPGTINLECEEFLIDSFQPQPEQAPVGEGTRGVPASGLQSSVFLERTVFRNPWPHHPETRHER